MALHLAQQMGLITKIQLGVDSFGHRKKVHELSPVHSPKPLANKLNHLSLHSASCMRQTHIF